MKRYTAVVIAAIAMACLTGALSGEALALDCAAGGGNLVGAQCQITTAVTGPCPYSLTLLAGQDLLITSTGSISCNDPAAPLANGASDITITVPGGNMEMQSGSEITAENKVGGGSGANISITVSGDFLMRGTGTAASSSSLTCAAVAGACISSSDSAGGGGQAGTVTITVGNFPNSPPVGVVTMEPGSAVLANSTQGSAGEIIITSGLQMDIDGLVRSFGGITGTGANQPRGGGPITLKTGCELVITPDGVVSSEGFDPGADLVHLEGCEVAINGLVQSIARNSGGHVLPVNPPNRCNNDAIAHPPGLSNGFTACVEIWGNSVTINSIAPNQGEVNANGVRGPFRSWIDVIGQTNVTINNDLAGNYSVHANSATATNSNAFGGVITIKALTGAYASTGEAVQANGTGVGSDGGIVTIQASSDVGLTASSVEARGPNGSNTRGGTINVRSFSGAVTGTNATGELDAAGGGSGGVPGSVTLSACSADPALTYTGAVTPAPTVVFPACAPASPTPPAAFVLQFDCSDPACTTVGPCVKRGTKFQDVDGGGQPRQAGEPGLPGWKIRAYTFPGNVFTAEVTTGASGQYEFPNLACGTYTFCEVLQPSWTQTFPAAAGGDVVSCVGIDLSVTLGPLGYQETLVPGQPSEGNDFGNHLPVFCKEDPDAGCTINVGSGGFSTVQAAYTAANSGDVICLFINTTENVVLDGSKSLTITQCTTARVTAANNSLPVWTVSSTAPLTIIGPDARNGSIGFSIESDGHDIRGVRASGATQVGIKITGDNNGVSFNSVSGNAVGVRIEGTGNDVRGGTVSGNSGNGVELGLTASNNRFRGATVRNNTADGIRVSGPNNKLQNNRVYGNSGDGIEIVSTATGTRLEGNQSGGTAENLGPEYRLGVNAIDGGSNRADGILIPNAVCPTFPAAGVCE